MLAAIVAGTIAVMAILQKKTADNRAEWWRRSQWMMERILTGNNDEKTIGLLMLAHQVKSKLATDEDIQLFDTLLSSLRGFASRPPEPKAPDSSRVGAEVVDEGHQDDRRRDRLDRAGNRFLGLQTDRADNGEGGGGSMLVRFLRRLLGPGYNARSSVSAAKGGPDFDPRQIQQPYSRPEARAESDSEHRVQVAAARLRVSIDERLGRETPPEVKELASEEI